MKLPTDEGGDQYRARSEEPVSMLSECMGLQKGLAVVQRDSPELSRYDSQIELNDFLSLNADELCVYMALTAGLFRRPGRFSLCTMSDYSVEWVPLVANELSVRRSAKHQSEAHASVRRAIARVTGFRNSYVSELLYRVCSKCTRSLFDRHGDGVELVLLNSRTLGMRPTWVRWWTFCDMLIRNRQIFDDARLRDRQLTTEMIANQPSLTLGCVQYRKRLHNVDFNEFRTSSGKACVMANVLQLDALRAELADVWLWDRHRHPTVENLKVRERDLALFFESSLVFDSPTGKIILCRPVFEPFAFASHS